jgi:ATP-dependent Clp protease protease subunit
MGSSVQPPPTPELEDVYAAFTGSIDQAAVQRIVQNMASATVPENKIGHVHLLWQSTGGFVGDGVFLYNFFRSFTVDLTIYNAGSVSSIATIAYLGAKKRKTSARASFMVHRTHASPQGASSARLQAVADSVAWDDARIESILRDHVKFTPKHWADLDRNDLVFSGEESVTLGIADELGEFSPPPKTRLYNL